MLRMILAVVLLASFGATGDAFAQAGCQPTIMQPCAKAPDKANNPTARIKSSGQSDDTGDPKDRSPRIRLNQDTDFKFGTGGLGLQLTREFAVDVGWYISDVTKHVWAGFPS